ncbi:MAG: hypothetical protein IKN31_07915 [Bacteroidales bacterium]|nr:hypothetical protein [Bacteroidales bacterium]
MKRFGRLFPGWLIAAAAVVAMAAHCRPEPPEPPDPPKPEVLFIDTAYDISCDGATITFTLEVTDAWKATVIGGGSWCTLDKTSGPAGTMCIVATITPNKELIPRNCLIKLKIGDTTGEITINQAQLNVLTASPDQFQVPAEGGVFTTEITTNITYEVTLSDEWITWDNGSITVSSNPDSDERTATIILSGSGLTSTIAITQSGMTLPPEPLDGIVTVMQSHARGNGIPLILMGDAFTAGMNEDGTYRAAMESAVEAFFGEEPYTTFRDMFDVYMVNVVSDQYTDFSSGTSTTLGTGFHGDDIVSVNLDKCQEYALLAVEEESVLDRSVIIVLANRETHSGRCFLTFIDRQDGAGEDGICGLAVAVSALGTSHDDFVGLIQHEAGGHGFGKLADEYSYEGIGAIPESVTETYKRLQATHHAYVNVDFTDNPESVLWSRFIADERYRAESIGIFPGGFGYELGVWHPTGQSIMNLDYGGYNAPSREAIYIRLHKLAFGAGWEYDFDEFAAFDIKSEEVISQQARHAARSLQRKMAPCPPPVIIAR